MKGTVQAGSAVTNQFKLVLPGLPEIYFTRVGELSRELVIAEMADGTWQSTGRIKPGEVECEQYMHHLAERVAMEAWHQACATGAPGHKIAGEMFYMGADGQPVAAYILVGVLNKGRKTPEVNVAQEGEGVQIVWMLAFDDVVQL